MSYLDSEQSIPLLLLAIVSSFIVASSLVVYPLNSSIATLRPMIMIMVLIFWLLFQPRYVGVFTAFVIGITADLIMDTRLGQQAFAAVIVAFFIKISSIYVKELRTSSAWLLASAALIIFQLNLWLLQIYSQGVFIAQSTFSLLMSIVSWPLLLLVLSRFVR